MIIFFFTCKIYYNLHTHNTTMQQWDISLRSVVIYRIDTVLLGVLAGFIASEYPQFWQKQQYRFALAGFLLVGILLFCLGYLRLKILDFPFFWNVLCLPINAVGLVCFLPFFSQWKTAPLRITRRIELVSELSYAIYLVHYSIVLFLLKHFIDSSAYTMLHLHILTLAYLSVTFLLSYLMYTYFEKPMMKLRDIKI